MHLIKHQTLYLISFRRSAASSNLLVDLRASNYHTLKITYEGKFRSRCLCSLLFRIIHEFPCSLNKYCLILQIWNKWSIWVFTTIYSTVWSFLISVNQWLTSWSSRTINTGPWLVTQIHIMFSLVDTMWQLKLLQILFYYIFQMVTHTKCRNVSW